jgi:hypothetical protein
LNGQAFGDSYFCGFPDKPRSIFLSKKKLKHIFITMFSLFQYLKITSKFQNVLSNIKEVLEGQKSFLLCETDVLKLLAFIIIIGVKLPPRNKKWYQMRDIQRYIFSHNSTLCQRCKNIHIVNSRNN